jgi:U2-associated protein SR140
MASKFGGKKPVISLKANAFAKKRAEREERRKIDDQQAAQVYEEFVATFSESSSSAKTFVRGSTINPDSRDDSTSRKSGSVYKPTNKLLEVRKEADERAVKTPPAPSSSSKPSKIKKEKGKTVLELFREELRRQQEEREERKKLKRQGVIPIDAPDVTTQEFKVQEFEEISLGSHDTGNPLTTNLYIGNIHPKMNEEMLCHTFGKYGALASVKVMWPRTEEERSRNKNCGFVAFMKREDAEKCLDDMKGSEIMGYQIQIGWGKAVALPPAPIYVSPDQLEQENLKDPDPSSGLPFNAQVKTGMRKIDKDGDNLEQLLYMTHVRVVIPRDKEMLQLIHRMIEFVIREGPMFEAMLMHREMGNPKFSFLFQNQSPEHIYYRWKLFSILNGDSPETWKTAEFRMFIGGSMWKPPPLKSFRPVVMQQEEIVKRGQLSTKNREELESQLHKITMERKSIADVMVWCVDHADSAQEIVECIAESLCIEETPHHTKLARLYLVNDILQNTSSKAPSVMNLKRGFESKLQGIIEHFHGVLQSIPTKPRAASFKKRVMMVLRALQEQSVYHWDFMTKVTSTFLGHTTEEIEKKKAFETVAALMNLKQEPEQNENEEFDGIPLPEVEEDLDGVPMDFSKPIDFSRSQLMVDDDDIDGVPLDPDLDGEPLEEDDSVATAQPSAPVVKSKWDDVEDDEDTKTAESSTQLMSAAQTVDEKRRQQLRQVEMKVLELVDALEGQSYTKEEISAKTEKYRQKLLREMEKNGSRDTEGSKKSLVSSYSRSPSPLEEGETDTKSSRDKRSPRSPDIKRSSTHRRSRSPHSSHSSRSRRHRSRSRSPRRHKRSRSRSRSPRRNRGRH